MQPYDSEPYFFGFQLYSDHLAAEGFFNGKMRFVDLSLTISDPYKPWEMDREEFARDFQKPESWKKESPAILKSIRCFLNGGEAFDCRVDVQKEGYCGPVEQCLP